jgi:hypothetical protein
MYLSKLAFFLTQKYKELGNLDAIKEAFKNIKNEKFAKIIKIYILKLIFNLMDRNYDQFQSFNFGQIGIDLKALDQQKNKKKEKENENMLNYFFLPLDKEDLDKYIKETELFLQNKDFDSSNKDIANSINTNGVNIFLSVVMNKIIGNLSSSNKNSKDNYKKFSAYMKSTLGNNSKIKISKELYDLLNLFCDSQIYESKIKPQLLLDKNIFNQNLFEILLYGYSYCVNTLDNIDNKNGNLLFKSLLSKDCINVIEKSFIPGNDDKEDLHISSLDSIDMHFKTFSDSHGCYVCSCGYYYLIEPCGFPTTNRTFDCPICKKKLGWAPKKVNKGRARNHGMVIREGHYRIFKDLEQKKGQMKRWEDVDENIPNKILEKYIEEDIEKIRKTLCTFGFNSISRDYFLKQDKKIRRLSNIGYRLLNFISYSHLFFNYCLGNINLAQLNKYLIQDMSILKIIEYDWNLLKESLQKRNINNINIFMNMIFKKLSKLIKECKCLTMKNERDTFEMNVENLINECIKDFPNYSKKYTEENKKQSEVDIYSLRSLISELILPSEEVYPENNYPMFKYFILTKYKTEDDMAKRMENRDKYPLINQLIAGNPGVQKLSNLQSFNEFTNHMVDIYSFRISREDAKKKDFCSEEVYKKRSKDFSKKYDNFIKAWNEIKSEAKKYKCRPEMPIKDLSEKDKLICFLNDGGELLNGMYLASACQNFIEWQNTFLQPIVDANTTFDGILHNYVDAINRKVPIQEAKHDQIVLINERFKKSTYLNLNDVIYSFSERKIFNEKGKINYSDYNTFVYDYPSIEEELGKIILPGVCLFEGEDNLNFVTFWGEGFRGGKTEMLTIFYSNYPQKDLDEKEREIIIQYIDRMNTDKMTKNNVKYDFKDFFGSMQLLIFYLTEKKIMKAEDKIVNILKAAPGYFKLSKDCRNFFYDEGKDLSIDKLMNVFFFFEHLCFEDLAETLQLEYREKIPEELKKQIEDKLLKKEKNPEDKYTIKDLGAATRRFISRYLAGKLEVTDIKEDRELAYELTREELWEERIAKIEGLGEDIGWKLKDFNLRVGQAYEFYNLIGEEDRNALIFGKQKEKNNIKKEK